MAFDLYIVTDEAVGLGRSHTELARMALEGGADVIQLRDKTMPSRRLYQVASEIRALTLEAGALFIVNDRVDIALASMADGVHLGQQDLAVGEARRITPPDFIIGCSVGNPDEAELAEAAGADYIALSPIFPTTSKDDAGNGHGIATLRSIRSASSLPLVAIGGISRGNVAPVIAAGADGVAVISAVLGFEDVRSAAAELREAIRMAKREPCPEC
ncbi:thiamine-phosphate pyrophosphorylase [Methanocalculus alkaliphilus]|uniref:thiamine phosphate synthase n=1 Tax=Methanocalculus alkaliphilus TaxID=768730 RepID=UPI00209ECE1B|nr:thiamine-phosphate pyrophosphorylase [Methanocalculus alkaliphilus]